MVIKGKRIEAQHDTGAERGNFMPLELARGLKLSVTRKKSDRKYFAMGNGKIVRALGRVKAACAFACETSRKPKTWFYVFEQLAAPLIMGAEFLSVTKTISTYTDRLAERLSCGSIIPVVNLIGSTQRAKRRFLALINGRQTCIDADSGSDLDLMAPAYVKEHGLQINRRRDCRKRVQFADTSIGETIGQVEATMTLSDGRAHTRLFDVLPGLKSDVVLGTATLAETEVFTAYEDCFTEVLAGERHFKLNILSYLDKVNNFLARSIRVGASESRTPQQRE